MKSLNTLRYSDAPGLHHLVVLAFQTVEVCLSEL